MWDNDTQVAVKTKWDAAIVPDATIVAHFPLLANSLPVGITDIVVGGLHEQPVNIDQNDRPQEPYCVFDVFSDGRTNQYSAGGGEIDFRRLRFFIYGTQQSYVVEIMKVVDREFDEQPMTIANAEWMRTEAVPENHGRLEKADKANADSFWKGTLEFRIWSSRQKAAMVA